MKCTWATKIFLDTFCNKCIAKDKMEPKKPECKCNNCKCKKN